MIAILLRYWKYAVIALLVVALGVQEARITWLKMDAAETALALVKQQRDAAQMLSDLTAARAARDAAASEFARNIDHEHANATRQIAQAIDAARADFSQQLRRIASRSRCPSPGTVEAVDTGVGEGDTASRRDRLLEAVGNDLAELGRSALDLAIYAKACHAFATEVGR